MSSLNISIFQTAARDETPALRLNWLDMAADRASKEGSDLLICPELSLSGFSDIESAYECAMPALGEYSDRVSEIAALHGVAIVYGYPEVDNQTHYNSAAFVTPDGKMLGHHRKNHIPAGLERDLFAQGQQIRVFEAADWKIALLIGYDIEFPEAARQAAMAGADLLIVPNALVSQRAFVVEKVIPTRAVENGVFVVHANWAGQQGGDSYVGRSRIIAPDGSEQAVAGDAETILSAKIDLEQIARVRAQHPYLQDRRKYDF